MKRSLTMAPSRARSMPEVAIQRALACTFFAALVAVFARIAIPLPFTPVPFSMQPLAIMLTGMFLGPWGGFFALLEYLVAGALGAPVFASANGGLPYMLATPTLGYLLSYPFAAYVIGRLAEMSRLRFSRLFLAALAGLAVIYLGGNLYLGLWLHRGPVQTLLLGAAPFIVFDVIKALIAAGAAATTSASWFAWQRR